MKHSPFIVGDFKIKSVKEDDTDYYMVEGYASIYGNIDSYRDIVMPGAFTKDLMENGKERPILWQHNSDEPIGMGTFEDSDQGLKVCIKMPKADDFVSNRVMPQIKVGAVQGLSIGYWTVKEEWDNDSRTNRLMELKLRETSAVCFPANTLAQITACKQYLGIEESEGPAPKMFKLADESEPWDKEEAVKNIKENTGSTDSPSKSYGIGFLEQGDGKGFDTYRHPYVKYIDGEFRIVPAAIFNAAGKVAFTGDAVVKEFVNGIYKKMGKEEPFKSGGKFFVDSATLKHVDKKDLDSILDSENTILSTGAKELIIEALRSPGEGGSVPGEDDGLLKAMREANNEMKTIQEELNG